jgi:hypothetical protein
MKKVLIMVGLPASGKSTFSNNYYEQYNKVGYYSTKGYRVNHVDIDKMFEQYGYNKFDKAIAIKKMISDNCNCEEIILDGLFLTNADIIQAVNEVDNHCTIEKIEIHYWIPNIENCLWNDKYRRNEHSEITIKNAKIEIPNINELKKEFKDVSIEVITHEVERKSGWKIFADKYGIELNDDGKMGSRYNSWCLGGSYQNCWGTGGSVEGEAQPITYESFDTLLEKACPSITFLQYKKLYAASVEIQTYDEHDYYGGSTSHAYFECDIERLYEGLVELGLINEEY